MALELHRAKIQFCVYLMYVYFKEIMTIAFMVLLSTIY